MKQQPRRLAGIALLAIGLVLAAVVVVTVASDDRAAGDVQAVESALRPSALSATPDPQPTFPTTTTSTTAAPETAPRPEEADESLTLEPAVAAPVALRIQRLGVDAPIIPHGVDANGQMDVPANVTEVAWYQYGSKPGESGSAVLAAHVDLASQGRGVFYELRTLEEGASVVVTSADGDEETYRVVAKVVYDKDELPLDVIFSREGPPVLTLITCGGGFNSGLESYDSNVVVYAVPMDGSLGSSFL